MVNGQIPYAIWLFSQLIIHEVVIKRKHFPWYWPFVQGIHRSTDEFPSQRLVTRIFDVLFDLPLYKQLSKQPRSRLYETLCHSLWRHCNLLCRPPKHRSFISLPHRLTNRWHHRPFIGSVAPKDLVASPCDNISSLGNISTYMMQIWFHKIKHYSKSESVLKYNQMPSYGERVLQVMYLISFFILLSKTPNNTGMVQQTFFSPWKKVHRYLIDHKTQSRCHCSSIHFVDPSFLSASFIIDRLWFDLRAQLIFYGRHLWLTIIQWKSSVRVYVS